MEARQEKQYNNVHYTPSSPLRLEKKVAVSSDLMCRISHISCFRVQRLRGLITMFEDPSFTFTHLNNST